MKELKDEYFNFCVVSARKPSRLLCLPTECSVFAPTDFSLLRFYFPFW